MERKGTFPSIARNLATDMPVVVPMSPPLLPSSRDFAVIVPSWILVPTASVGNDMIIMMTVLVTIFLVTTMLVPTVLVSVMLIMLLVTTWLW